MSLDKEYAGVVIWIGDAKVVRVISKAEIAHEVVEGMVITHAAQQCLDDLAKFLKEKSNA